MLYRMRPKVRYSCVPRGSYLRKVRGKDCTIHFQSNLFPFYIIQGDDLTYFPYISSDFPCVYSDKTGRYPILLFNLTYSFTSIFSFRKKRDSAMKDKSMSDYSGLRKSTKRNHFCLQSDNSLFLEKIYR